MRRAWLLTLLITGCAQILDLEDRKFEANLDAGNGGTDGGADSAQPIANDGGSDAARALGCPAYCDDALELCPAGPVGQGVQIFELRSHCDAICALYPVGDSANPTGNTLACRAALLKDARVFGEAATICQAAGPGGTGFHNGKSCGTDCESFCNLREKVCPPPETEPNCMARCLGLPDNQVDSYNAKVDFASGKDSFNCRMAHLATAASYQAAGMNKERGDHCAHSGIKSTGPCDLSAKEPASCSDYCKLVMTGCSGDLKVYESQQQCEAWCGKLPNAANDSKVDNTVRCRREGAYAVLTGSSSERTCEAAGPVQLECGGSKCVPFCSLLLSTCGTQGPFQTQEQCVTSCEQIPDSKANRPINLKNANLAGLSNDTLSCRVANLLTAVGGDLRACPNALGTGTCK